MCASTASGRGRRRSSAPSARTNRLHAPAARAGRTPARARSTAARRSGPRTGRARRPSPSGRRARDEVERLGEHGMLRVERLRDEDEPQSARRATLSTSSRIAVASCSGVQCQSRVPPSRGRAEPFRQLAVARVRARAPPRARDVGRRHEEALDAVGDEIRDAAASVATTARPRANASITTRPIPSGHDGSTSAVESSSAAATSSGSSQSWCTTRSGKSASEPLDTLRREPRPTITSRAAGTARRRAATQPRGRRRSCSARARRRRGPSAARAAAPGPLGEGREVAEGGEDAVGGRPRTSSTRLRGERRDGPRRVGVPDRRRPRCGRRAGQQPPRGRAVEPRERAPVAVHLDDHRRPAAGPASCPRARRRRRTDRRRSPPPAGTPAARGARGTAAAGGRASPSSRRGRSGRASRTASSLGALPAVGGAEHAIVELLLDRVPLLRQPAGKRQAVARRDRRRARAGRVAHRAASASSASSRP